MNEESFTRINHVNAMKDNISRHLDKQYIVFVSETNLLGNAIMPRGNTFRKLGFKTRTLALAYGERLRARYNRMKVYAEMREKYANKPAMVLNAETGKFEVERIDLEEEWQDA